MPGLRESIGKLDYTYCSRIGCSWPKVLTLHGTEVTGMVPRKYAFSVLLSSLAGIRIYPHQGKAFDLNGDRGSGGPSEIDHGNRD